MLRLCEPVIDIVFGAGPFEGVRPDGFAFGQAFFNLLSCRADSAGRGEVCAVVREHGLDFARHSRDQGSRKVCRDGPCCLLMRFGEGKL